MEVGYYFFTVFITLDTLYSWVATLQTCQKWISSQPPYVFSIITKNQLTDEDSLCDKITGNPTRYEETLKYPVPIVD